MTSREIVIRIDRKALIVAAAVALIVTAALRLWSESLTLVTTYPAPSGIYNQIVTTGNSGSSPADTTLNRNAGNTIIVPATNGNGRVGIGTSAPSAAFHVVGYTRQDSGVGSFSIFQKASSAVGNFWQAWRNSSGADIAYIGYTGSSPNPSFAVGNMEAGGSLNLYATGGSVNLQSSGGKVGIGTGNPDSRVTVRYSAPEDGLTVRNDAVSIPASLIASVAPNDTSGQGHLLYTASGGKNRFWVSTNGNVYVGSNAEGSLNLGGGYMVLYGNGNLNMNGTLNVGGSKNFRIDHPLKRGYKLVHSSLEGPEAAVYYRGKARLSKGEATVALPDYFEALTRAEGRTVSLTPVGSYSSLYVAGDVADGRFTVKTASAGGADQSFYWEVRAVRKDLKPLVPEEIPAP